MLSFIWKKPQSTNIKPLENKVQQIENKVQNVEQKIQTLENSNNQLIQEITTLQAQIQALAASIQPILNDARHFVKANQTNNFQVVQKITADGAGINFEQFPNQSGYINFSKNDGSRRGYVGMSSGRNDEIGLMGKEGIHLTTTSGDVIFNPGGSINANNNTIKNLADPQNPNDAISWDYLSRRIRTVEGTWNNNNPGWKTWPNLQGGVGDILNFELWYQYNTDIVPGKAYAFRTTNNGNDLEFRTTYLQGDIPPSNLFKVKVKMTYITLR